MSVATKVIIESLHTNISGEKAGTLSVTWDLAVLNTPNPDCGQRDWWEPEYIETREVAQVRLVELQLFDKEGLNITVEVFSNPHAYRLLCKKLIASTLDKDLSEVKGKEVAA